MPKYFFEVLELDGAAIHDVVELELPDAQQALDMASRTLMEVLTEKGLQHPTFHVMIVVKDDKKREVGRRDGAVSQSNPSRPSTRSGK